MAKRDVELIIRAKDEATKAIDSVSLALKSLVTSQTDLTGSATKVDTALTRLGSAMGTLNKQFAQATAVEKTGLSLDKAAASMSRLQSEAIKTAADQERFAKGAAESAARVTQLTAEADRSAIAIAKQRAAFASTKIAQGAYTAQIKETEAVIAKLGNEETRLSASFDKTSASVSRAETRYDAIRQTIEAVVTPTAAMSKAFNEASAALAKQDAKLAGITAAQVKNREAMAATSGTLAQLQARLAAANADFLQQQTILAKLESEYRNMVSAARLASEEEGRLQEAAALTAISLQKQEAELAQASASLGLATAEMNKLSAAQAKLASAGVGVLIRALKQQQADTVAAKADMDSLSASAAILGQRMFAAGPPTEQVDRDFRTLRASMLQARAEFEAQGASLQEMRATLLAVRAGTISLADAQHQFVASSAGLTANLNAARAATGTEASELARLGAETAAAATAQGQLKTNTAAVVPVMGAAATKVTQYTKAIKGSDLATRQALSIMQRLRAEVLSLISAYAGFFGAIQGVRNLIDATVTLQQAQNRLNVIFSGPDSVAKSADTFDFLRRNADFLGISLGVLSDQFTRFASSTLDTNIEGENTRKIFLAVSDASAQLGLSIDDIEGVFKALGQIASKGNVQMEELRGQLGDRFPAALKLMADGLGVSIEELNKMVKAGKVSADALLPFADRINKLYGKELPAALQQLPALLGKLGQAGFNALTTIDKSGFIEKFKEFIVTLTKFLQSAQAQSFFQRLGALLGVVVDTLGFFVEHIQLASTLIAAFVGLKISPFLISMALNIGKAGKGFITLGRNAATAAAIVDGSMLSIAGATTAATVALEEFFAVLISTGVGAGVAVIGAIIAGWALSTDQATEAMNRHQSILDAINTKYDRLRGTTDAWAKSILTVTLQQATESLNGLTVSLEAANKAMLDVVKVNQAQGGFPEGSPIFLESKQIEQLITDFSKLKGATQEQQEAFKKALSAIGTSTAFSDIKRITSVLQKQVDESAHLQTGFRQADAIVKALATGSVADLATAMNEINKDPFGPQADSAGALGSAIDKTSKATKDLESEWRKLTDKAESLDGVVQRIGKSTQKWVEIHPGVKVTQEMAKARIATELYNETNTKIPTTLLEAERAAADVTKAIVSISDKVRAAGGADAIKPLNDSLNQAKTGFDQVAIIAAGSFQKIGEGIKGVKQIIETAIPPNLLSAPFLEAQGEINKTADVAKTSMAGVKDIIETQLPDDMMTRPWVLAQEEIAKTDAALVVLSVTGAKTGADISAGVLQASTALTTINTTVTALPATLAAALAPILANVATFVAGLPPILSTGAASILATLGGLSSSVQSVFSTVVSNIASQFRALASLVSNLIAQLKAELASLQSAISAAQASLASAQAAAAKAPPGHARGGMIHGPGTGTSDSILSRLSRGEYVIKAAAVRKYGAGLLAMINQMLLPKTHIPRFAAGGPVDASTDALPQLMSLFGNVASPKPVRVVNLTIEGETFDGMVTPEDTARSLMRFARKRQMRSAGRKPAWVGGAK